MLWNLHSLRRALDERRAGQTVVFTNGCFDIIHAGHVRLLAEAKSQGEILIVALNSDASVRRLKGPTRPVNTLQDRAAVVAAISSVDYVTSFQEDTPEDLIRALEPDVLVKGADWCGKPIAGASLVRRVHFVEALPERSTTGILRRIGENSLR